MFCDFARQSHEQSAAFCSVQFGPWPIETFPRRIYGCINVLGIAALNVVKGLAI
jgi:hypothetical protein